MPLPNKSIGCLGIFVITFVASYFYLQHSNYYTALDATKEWARIAEFPASATDINVKVTGGVFSRGFVVTFDAPIADINNWIAISPGTSGVTPESNKRIRRYQIEPGGGAQFAEIEVDDGKERVKIHTYWS